MSGDFLHEAGRLKLKGMSHLAQVGPNQLNLWDETVEARKAFLQAVVQDTEHALSQIDQMTPQGAERYVAEVIACLKGAFVKTRMLKKLPNPRYHRP